MLYLAPVTCRLPLVSCHVLLVTRHCLSKWNIFKVGHLLECTKALINLIMCQLLHSGRAKLLHVERCHDGAEYHRPPHRSVIQVRLTGKIPKKPAGKAVTGTGWVKNRLERISWDRKIAFIGKKCGAVFAALDDQSLGAPRQYCSGRLD